MNQQNQGLSFEDLKPVNIIQNGLENLLKSLDINKTVLVMSSSIAALYISNKIFKSSSVARLANVLVPVILMVAIKTITNHPEKSKLAVKTALKKIGKVVGSAPDTTYFS
ncbi:MAG: hypothetical protein RIR48_2564 [Bacteroidota bacterium]